MKRKELLLSGPEGLTSTEAKSLVQTACQFKSQISIEVENKRVNAKSMMGILTIANIGRPVIIEAEGEDEEAVIAEFTRLATNGLK